MPTSAELVWLLAGVAKSDVAAFERLYAATRAKLYGVVLGIVQGPALAGEVLQDAYLAIWTAAPRFDPVHATPMTWMVAIARAHAIAAARRTGAIVIDMEADPDADASEDRTDAAEAESADAADPPAARVASEALKRLLAGLGRLEPDRQRMLLLAYFSGTARTALAAEFDRPVDTIRTQLRHALADLREFLGNE
ncbi:sigma-70 family RNA polymerase sigma factor [Rhodoplanes sp. TEM]|uniref:Sigma-70 family RNA polymerase sigma factor n=1 Tax=Rhodoplanes tepidamans TaxID=200616 RepID=A0ABT5J631_RHOTP|nr:MULTISPECIES: sigma-70 family RNA polymerase sigma factor [Rhodoplanes]MDC7785117.1 sigma-70 family RNA polymerase sigma factor [Rhodoplanes tepidamans]MDC7982591.1 sigma-70 family RNA polymerase sigma factor [Rhodoplanes sp. TEM]MDQ0356607.1 RNA polymerase sigma-70 factor (ECF subfamily) [Rhodoplanes tepidamans]